MPRFHVWVSQLRTLDIIVDADSSHTAEARVRARLKNSPDAEPWLDSATVIRSTSDGDGPGFASRVATSPLPPTRQLLNTTEAATYLGISRTKVYELLNSGALESTTIGRLRRVSIDHLQRFLTSQR